MTRYDFLKDKKLTIKIFVNLGVIPVSIHRHLEVMDFYSKLPTTTKMQNYQDTAEAFKMQPRQVMNIVKDMSAEIELLPGSKFEIIKISQ
jgi:hypothetical protein